MECQQVNLPEMAQFLLNRPPLKRLTRVVDVDANPNVGDQLYKSLLQARACDDVGFEPQPGVCVVLANRKSAGETYFPFAIGDASHKELKIYRSEGNTSVYEHNVPGIRVVGKAGWEAIDERIELNTVALDDRPDAGSFDLLKIDIQGGEYDVLHGAKKTVKAAIAVIVELRCFQFCSGKPMMSGVDMELRGQGFLVHKFTANAGKPLRISQCKQLNGALLGDQLIDGDAVYLRDLALIETYSDEQICHLSVFAASAIGCHTLVLHGIDELARRQGVDAGLAAFFVDEMPTELHSKRRRKARKRQT